jgi:hypothetical protein
MCRILRLAGSNSACGSSADAAGASTLSAGAVRVASRDAAGRTRSLIEQILEK